MTNQMYCIEYCQCSTGAKITKDGVTCQLCGENKKIMIHNVYLKKNNETIQLRIHLDDIVTIWQKDTTTLNVPIERARELYTEYLSKGFKFSHQFKVTGIEYYAGQNELLLCGGMPYVDFFILDCSYKQTLKNAKKLATLIGKKLNTNILVEKLKVPVFS